MATATTLISNENINNGNGEVNLKCIHDKDKLSYSAGKMEKGECILECDREGRGHMSCRCGSKFCLVCYGVAYPEERGKYKYVENDCEHDREKLKFKYGFLDPQSCITGCGRTDEGYLMCKCGVKHCILCYEEDYPEDKGKFDDIKKKKKKETEELDPKKKCLKLHPMIYRVNPKFKRTCSTCNESGLIRFYVCEDCEYFRCLNCVNGEDQVIEESFCRSCNLCNIF